MVTAHQLRSIWTASAAAQSAEIDKPEHPHSVLPLIRRWFSSGHGALPPRRIRQIAFGLIVLAAVVWSAVPQIMAYLVRPDCHSSILSVPDAPVALVLGAGITTRGRLSPVLRERVNAAVALYRAGKVRFLLMTGDNGQVTHNEPWAMRRYALREGVPASAIYCDYAGFHTYDSCYRARRIFGVDRAVIVTQPFHLARAVFLARELGIDASGYAAADPLDAASDLRMAARENTSSLGNLLELAIHRRPHFLGKPILMAKM